VIKKKTSKKLLYSNTLSSKISNSCLTYTEVVKIRKCFRCNKLSSPASNPNKGVGGVMVFNATFNNISAITWRSVLLVEETRVPEKTTDLPEVTDKLDHKCCIEYTSPWTVFELITLVVIGTDCTGSHKPNYHTIMTRTAPPKL